LEEIDTAIVKVSSKHESSSIILVLLDISVGKDDKKNRGEKEVKKKKQSKALQDTKVTKLIEFKKKKKSLLKSKDTRIARKLKDFEKGKESIARSKRWMDLIKVTQRLRRKCNIENVALLS
jgi:hypothetical protein